MTFHRSLRRVANLVVALVIIVASLATATVTSAAEPTFDEYARSPQLSGEHADVLRLYWAFFDREPDVGGSQYWVGEYDRCISLRTIADVFRSSVEFQQTYGQLTNAEFTRLIYNNVMDREPDAEGGAYWLGLLDTGRVDRSSVMLYFSISDEFRVKRPLPSDAKPYGGCVPPAPEPYYANCDAVRDAHAAPLERGEPGYRSGLDRDGDGIACEN